MKFIADLASKLTSPSSIIDSKAFQPQEGLSLFSPFQHHVAWVYKNIYSVPYPKAQVREDHIARYHHGVQHVTRAAIYAMAWINLYRRHGDPEALALTDEDVRLIQIALLFHDAARLNDDKDEWDKESGDMLYDYLTRVLGVEEAKARLLQDAVANKEKNPPNIYQKIIHDADCLDIIRARPHFDANYLHFYQQVVCQKSSNPRSPDFNNQAFEEMASLIIEARGLIEAQGDRYGETLSATKIKYENANAYGITMSDILRKPHSLLAQLAILLPKDSVKTLPGLLEQKQEVKKEKIEKEIKEEKKEEAKADYNEKTLTSMMRQGLILGRAITDGHALIKKNGKPDETAAAKEFRKVARRRGVETRTQKKDAKGMPLNITKHGNERRSTTYMGCGVPMYGGEGMVIINVDLNSIHEGRTKDYSTGFGKKKDINRIFSLEEKEAMLFEIKHKQKMGGDSQIFGRAITNYNEILYHVTHYDGVYFSPDPNAYNYFSFGRYQAFHRHVPALRAIFLRNEYEKVAGVRLPIFEYSGIHDYVAKKEFEEKEIVQMWVEMVSDYIDQQLKQDNMIILELSIDQLKIASMFKKQNQEYIPADSNYPEELQQEITSKIISLRDEKIKDVAQKIKKDLSIIEKSLLPRVILNHEDIKPLVSDLLQKYEPFIASYLAIGLIKGSPPASQLCDRLETNKTLYKADELFSRCSGFTIAKHFYLAKSIDMQKMTENIQERIVKCLVKYKSHVFDWILMSSIFEFKEEKTISKMANDHLSIELKNLESKKIFKNSELNILEYYSKSLKVFTKFNVNIGKDFLNRFYLLMERVSNSLPNDDIYLLNKYLDIFESAAWPDEYSKCKENIVRNLKKPVLSCIEYINKNTFFYNIEKNNDLMSNLISRMKKSSLLQDDDIFVNILKIKLVLNKRRGFSAFEGLNNLKCIFRRFLPCMNHQRVILEKTFQSQIFNELDSFTNSPDEKERGQLQYIQDVFSKFEEIIDDEFLLDMLLKLMEKKYFNDDEMKKIESWLPQLIFRQINLIQFASGDKYHNVLNLLKLIPPCSLKKIIEKCDKLKTLSFKKNMGFLFHLFYDMQETQSNLAGASTLQKERATAIKRLIDYIQEEKNTSKIEAALSHFEHVESSVPQGKTPDYSTYDPKQSIELPLWPKFSFSNSSDIKEVSNSVIRLHDGCH